MVGALSAEGKLSVKRKARATLRDFVCRALYLRACLPQSGDEMVVGSVKDSVEARPSTERSGKGCFSVVNSGAATLHVSLRWCALCKTTRAYIYIYIRRIRFPQSGGKTRRREGGREGSVSSSVRVVAVLRLPGVMNRMENF